MKWNTEEATNWFLNDEYLYGYRKSPAWMLRELWLEGPPTTDVDVSEVDWDEIEEFFKGE